MLSIDIILSIIASLFAGAIDSIVGGGGLILVPSLFALFPAAQPATLFGTNKIASVSGTAIAAFQYSRRININWYALIPGAILAWLGSTIGAWTVTHIDGTSFRKALPFILLGIFAYTLKKKDFGTIESSQINSRREKIFIGLIASCIGFYDGFFGPGTGSFFIFLLVKFLGYDFLRASATSKILNTATNLSAIILFASKGHVWWTLGMIMAVSNIVGSLIGSRIAIKYGANFVRKFFIFMVGALIISNTYKIYFS